MTMSKTPSLGLILFLTAGLFAPPSTSAQPPKGPGKLPDFIPAGYDDYQNMLDQLGIKKVRPGRNPRNGDTSAEATANPWKDSLPDLMTFKDGTKVTSADQWPKRRAEIVEDFEREVYGRIPKNVPRDTWALTKTEDGTSGGTARGAPHALALWPCGGRGCRGNGRRIDARLLLCRRQTLRVVAALLLGALPIRWLDARLLGPCRQRCHGCRQQRCNKD